jgi:hypothetical protein
MVATDPLPAQSGTPSVSNVKTADGGRFSHLAGFMGRGLTGGVPNLNRRGFVLGRVV